MIPELLTDTKEILEAVHYLPSISIILPFEPKMAGKQELEYRLQRAFTTVKKELKRVYSAEKAMLVIEKLEALLTTVDYSTFKQSLAIYVSPLFEKIFYLDIPVEEKIIIDESFEIRDLIYSKKEIHKYLILVLSEMHSQIFIGNTTQFIRIISDKPAPVTAFNNAMPERTGNFSDPAEHKEVLLEKFLRHTDAGLGRLLKAYDFPLFIMGTDRITGHFKQITHYANRITGYVPGNFSEATEAAIREAIAPYVADWKKVKQQDLLLRIDAAAGARKLATGIKNVWQEASHKKGRLLVVEKNYMYAARQGELQDLIDQHDDAAPTPFYIKDAVDDVIEKVLLNGGDVEFVDKGMLNDYQQIALICWYPA